MDIVKRAYLKTMEEWPKNAEIISFEEAVRENIIRLIESGAYSRRQWPREMGIKPEYMNSLKSLKEHVYKKK